MRVRFSLDAKPRMTKHGWPWRRASFNCIDRMNFPQLPERARGYLIAVLMVALAIGVRFALSPILVHSSPLLIFTLPVAITALYGGYGPALLATALGTVLGTYLFVGGLGLQGMNAVDITRVTIFVMMGLTVSFLGGRLQASRQSLVDANRRKDEFLAMLGHELRNPLASISAAAELLRRDPNDPIGRLASIDVIRRQVGHMARLIDDLLDVTRIARGHVVLAQGRVNLHQVVRDAMEQTQALIAQKRHSLALDMDPPPEPTAGGGQELLEVHGDHARLVQVLANILMNAAKYTPPGGKLKLCVALDGSQVKLQVSDNGVGIAPELLPYVFDSFVQAERTADRAEGGLGLGLALVKNVVTMHGGHVAAHSKGPGQGSTFTVLLPRLPGGPQADPLAAATPTPRPNRLDAISRRGTPALPEPKQVVEPERILRILVVDDNADAAVSLGQLLEAFGHAVTVAFDAEQALQHAAEQVFDVALLDIGLPGLNGYELAARLRRLPRLTSCMLLALTGYGTASDSERSSAAGFDHHLVKPLDVDLLFALIGDRAPAQPLH